MVAAEDANGSDSDPTAMETPETDFPSLIADAFTDGFQKIITIRISFIYLKPTRLTLHLQYCLNKIY